MKTNQRKDFRQSQFIRPFGPGAVLGTGGETFMIAAPDLWDLQRTDDGHLVTESKIYDRRLAGLVGCHYFIPPGHACPAAVRFPSWLYCKVCHRLESYRSWHKNWIGMIRDLNLPRDMGAMNLQKRFFIPECFSCFASQYKRGRHWPRKNLIYAAPLMIGCIHGHLDEFPWSKWIHSDKDGAIQSDCSSENLRLDSFGSSLASIRVSCREKGCGAGGTLEAAIYKGALDSIVPNCSALHPWKNWRKDPKGCTDPVRVLQTEGSNLHYSIIKSSITVPPATESIAASLPGDEDFRAIRRDFDEESHDALRAATEGLEFLGQVKESAEALDAVFSESRRRLKRLAKKFSVDIDEIVEAIKTTLIPDAENEDTAVDVFKYEEFKKLRSPQPFKDEELLQVKGQVLETELSQYFAQINQVLKLREVICMTSFTRVFPREGHFGKSNEEQEQPTEIMLKTSDMDWLPGIEGYGEGIFFELNPKTLKMWRQKPALQAQRFRLAEESSNKARELNLDYQLIHSIAHLLIRQLSFESGYSIASIKERIYCPIVDDTSLPDEVREMRGLLIYTTTTDKAGTMGGLVRLGAETPIRRLLKSAIHAAKWCSSDPVCSESGQGLANLNQAACHSCIYVPETSCENFNCFLDRRMVVDTCSKEKYSYFEGLKI